jgi:hypothetical protein
VTTDSFIFDDGSDLWSALKAIRQTDESLFNGIFAAYHFVIISWDMWETFAKVRGGSVEDQLISNDYEITLDFAHLSNDQQRNAPGVMFIKLLGRGASVIRSIREARMRFPNVAFVLYGNIEDAAKTFADMPQAWRQRVTHFYQILFQSLGEVDSDSFRLQLRRILDLAKQTAIARATSQQQMGRDVLFISYSHRDRDLANELALRLSDESYGIWIDDTRLRGGTPWHEGIDDGLSESDVLVLLLSPSALESAQVQEEYQTFLDRGKPIIPVLIEPVSTLPSVLASIHYVDFTRLDFETGFLVLRDALRYQLPDV